MQFMGFGLNWVSWVKACLISSKSSVLVNGSPIAKFSLEWGLRQGDPMSSFLFLLVMEALNVAMSDAVELNIFKPLKVGGNKIMLRHLLYADDAIFIGKWSIQNVENFVLILKCFMKFRVSRLIFTSRNFLEWEFRLMWFSVLLVYLGVRWFSFHSNILMSR